MDLVTLRGVEVGYHRLRILPPVDLTIRRGTYLGIVGPNGSGKTTLVRTLLGLLKPVAGEITYPSGRRPRFGYVPQRSETDLSFPLTTLDMVAMGRFPRLGLGRRLGSAGTRAALSALERVGIGGLGDRPLHTLSGGQKQRALIARALCSDPEVLVLDEPTTGTDLVAESGMLDTVASLHKELDLGIVMISHHLGLIANSVSEVLLVDRERMAIEHGAVNEVVTPERLSHLYGANVTVQEVFGHRLVFLDRRKESR